MALIRGTVAKADGSAASGASVYLVSSPGSMPDVAQLTDDGGQFVMSAPRPGRYVIAVRSPDGARGQVEVAVASEAVVELELRLE